MSESPITKRHTMVDMRMVLVVEPELAIGNLIAEVLGDDGYQVRLVHDRTALGKALTTMDPDLLLYAIDRSGGCAVDWCDTAHAIAELSIPIVLMSTEPAWASSHG